MTCDNQWITFLFIAQLAKENGVDEEEWKQCWSTSFQRPYWHNTTTGENTWRDPFKHLKRKEDNDS